jgi:signal transduction histidine kinase
MDAPDEIIRLLIVEDSEDDYFLVKRELDRSGLRADTKRIDTPGELREELLHGGWDLIVSDYSMPELNAAEALRIVQSVRPDIPFICVSGSVGEELAVELMRSGASDYLMKDRLTRLPAVITREMRELEQLRQQRRLQRELRHLQKIEALGTLAGGIAHDFNNVLMAVNGYGELALEKLTEDHPAVEDLQQMIQAAGRSRTLVKKLMAFARRQEEAPPERLDLHRPVSNALSLLRPTMPASIEVSYNGSPGKHFVVGNSSELEQVVVNLCNNAAHAMGKRAGRIALQLDTVEFNAGVGTAPLLAAGSYHQLKVTDSGNGMTPEVRARVFEPFFTTKPSGEGTGLGLPMVHGVVNGMGGAIALDSEVGRGTTFSLYFPAAPTLEVEEATSVAKPRTNGNGQHIMVVDDEELLVNVTSVMLQQAGFRATKFFDPASALTAFKAAPSDYDLLLTDLAMPGMTGMELAREIKLIRPGLPVVLCTGYIGTPESNLLEQCSAVLQKPYTREALVTAINQALAVTTQQ